MSFQTKHAPNRSLADSQSGFTLIELIITITIFGILLAIAIPNLTSLVNAQRVKTATGDIYASLIFARSEAIKRNQFVAVCAKTDNGLGCQNATNWERGWIVFIDADGDGVPNVESDILKRQDELDDVSLPVTRRKVSLAGTSSNVSYQRDGRLRASVIPFVASSPGNSNIPVRNVILDLSGRPNIK